MSSLKEYSLTCTSGMEVKVRDAGAALASVCIPDRDGVFSNVVLPIKDAENACYAGVTLAPYSGRISQGKIEIEGKRYQLTLNDGKNHLHGGESALSHKLWTYKGRIETQDYQEICFSAKAKDGLDGYPGNRYFTTTYRLWQDQRLEILMTAITDQATCVNLSNHAYFNLSGDFSGRINEHLLHIDANAVYRNDDEFIAIGKQPPVPSLDFTHLRAIGEPKGHPQIDHAKGLNHCYVLNVHGAQPAAVLVDPGSGRRMRLYTDQPCVMVYSGGFLDNPNCALALEAQGHPLCRGVICPAVLYPGRIYRRQIVYQFDTVPKDRRELDAN